MTKTPRIESPPAQSPQKPNDSPSKGVARSPRLVAFGARLREARTKRGLSQHGLALRLGITAAAVGQWEIGANLPQMATFDKLVRELDVTRDWLLSDASPEERGVAQDVTEQEILRQSRSLSPEGRVAALTMMEEWKDLETGDPTALASLIERWVHLTPPSRAAALSMIDGLSRSEASNVEPKQPDVRRSERRDPSGRGKNKMLMPNW